MTLPPIWAYFGVRDAALRRATVYFRAPEELIGDDLTEVYEALEACSGAHPIARDVMRPTIEDDGTGSSDGDYASSLDSAVMLWQAEDGTFQRTSIPAPGDIFLPDNKTVDEENEDVQDLIGTMLLLPACSASGSPFVTFVRGWRYRLPEIGL